jgi:hypothetical protein
VPYRPIWEPLRAALERVIASGVAQQQAKIEICQAIADRKIGIRTLMEKGASNVGGKTLMGGNVEVPPRLDPADFDWVKSRPLARWNTGPDARNPTERYFAMWPWKPRSIELIELSTADVGEILCGGAGNPKPQPDEQSHAAHGEEKQPASEQNVDKETESENASTAGCGASAKPDLDQQTQPTQQRPAVTEPEEASTAGSTRPLTEKAAEKFTAEYVDREKQAGKRPSLKGLEAAAKEANWRGGRDFLRAAYKRIVGTEVTRGRPRK